MLEQTNFEKLRVYKLAEELADRIWFIVLKWDRFAVNTIGDQLVRAADGIGANIAEGSGRGSFKDNRRWEFQRQSKVYQHFSRVSLRNQALVASSL